MRLFAIGDIHGRADLLELLLRKLFTEEKLNLLVDKLIFLGDYMDRGPDSSRVVELVKNLQEMHMNNVICLYGNHEDLMIKAVDQVGDPDDPWGSDYWWRVNGGDQTVQSFGGSDCHTNHGISKEIINWIRSLPVFHEEPGFFFAHAPLPRENRRHIQNRGKTFTKEEYIWSRPENGDESGYARVLEGKIGVCGHYKKGDSSGALPRLYDHYWYIDTGCGCNIKRGLAAVECGSKRVIMAEVRDLPKLA